MKLRSSCLRGCIVSTLALSVCAALFPAHAQQPGQTTRDLDAIGQPIRPMPVDPAIVDAVGRVSVANIQHTIATLVGFHNRNTLSSMAKDLPPGQGAVAAANWITEQYRAYSAECNGCLEVKQDTFTEPGSTAPHSRITQPTVLTNVYAILPGSDPAQAKRVLLVTGHYDSRETDVLNFRGFAPGANDDGSGVAVSLECARVLSKLHFPATLIFVAVDGEEQGLYGSKHLAGLLKQQGWQIEGVLNNDIVGGDTTPGDKLQDEHAVRVFSEGIPASATPEEIQRIIFLGYESDSPSRELARAVVDISKAYGQPAGGRMLQSKTLQIRPALDPSLLRPVLEFRRDRFLRGGDHTSFNQEGFPAIRFTEWRENFNHQHQDVRTVDGVEYGDLIKFVNMNYVARVARLNGAAMAELATAPPPPTEVQVVTRNLDNNTTLQWKNGAGAPATTHYIVVWRPLASPDWERSIPAERAAQVPDGQYQLSGDEYSVTLPISKDNVIFGVEAVGPDGQRSVAVVPLPVR